MYHKQTLNNIKNYLEQSKLLIRVGNNYTAISQDGVINLRKFIESIIPEIETTNNLFSLNVDTFMNELRLSVNLKDIYDGTETGYFQKAFPTIVSLSNKLYFDLKNLDIKLIKLQQMNTNTPHKQELEYSISVEIKMIIENIHSIEVYSKQLVDKLSLELNSISKNIDLLNKEKESETRLLHNLHSWIVYR